MVILVLLGGVALFQKEHSIITDGMSIVDAHIEQFDVALLIYQRRAGFYPTTKQGLRALTVQPATDPIPLKWSTLLMGLPTDPWGNDYIYVQPGQHNPDGYDLYSLGADRIPNTADDIGNWQKK